MTIRYEPSALVISIPTSSPAATHAALLQSIASTMEYCAESKNKHHSYPDEVIPLLRLLKTMMPGEEDLVQMSGE